MRMYAMNTEDTQSTNSYEHVEYSRSAAASSEMWRNILQCKNDFLQKQFNPKGCAILRPEVAEHWVRSRAAGINPYEVDYRLDEQEFKKVLKENRLLIDIAAPLLAAYHDFVPAAALWLYDRRGVSMVGVKNINQSNQGFIWSEETVGTTAHTLAIRYKQPVQLIGPENYCVKLHDILCSAAPVLDEHDAVLGVLAFAQWLGHKPWETYVHDMHIHSLGWVSSLAAAIENQIKLARNHKTISTFNKKLQKVNEQLTTAKDTLEATLAFIDEGILTVDHKGSILNSNPEGARIFNLEARELANHNISEFLSGNSALISVIQSGGNADSLEENIRMNGAEEGYLISTRPIVKQGTKTVGGAVLRFVHADKVNALANRRVGSRAKFRLADIIGNSDALNKAKILAQRLAISAENILLEGESGTGKELFAQAIHNQSRPNRPFIALNCAAIPRNLVESELFGYERGAFTGAEKNGRPGKIELANGGTLFLDEIGDMPIEIQPVLLRVLEDRQVMRLGGKTCFPVDFRLVTATNKDLYGMSQKKLFREDLYFRLSVIRIVVPPLRERCEDIILLAEYFVQRYSRRMNVRPPKISQAAQSKLLTYQWPGNVRQLENIIIYAVNMAQGDLILPEHLLLESVKPGKIRIVGDEKSEDDLSTVISLKESEKLIIQSTYKKTRGNIPLTAGLLGISRATLYNKLREYQIPRKRSEA